jgi:hypothetical protein
MTKAKSGPFDNGMICESCNDPKTSGCPQTKYKVFLGGGLGWGDMWMCEACLEKAHKRDLEEANKRVLIVQEKLKELAHKLWIERGCPIGSPEVDWAEAKRRLRIPRL